MILLVVMASVVGPSFSAFFPGVKVRTAGASLVATAGKAHADAALTLHRYRMCFVTSPEDGTAPYHYLSFEPDPLREPGVFRKMPGGWGQPEFLPDDVTFESLDGAQDDSETKEKYFEFNTDGTATEGSIVLAHPKGERVTVKIAGATGAVSVEEPTETP